MKSASQLCLGFSENHWLTLQDKPHYGFVQFNIDNTAIHFCTHNVHIQRNIRNLGLRLRYPVQ